MNNKEPLTTGKVRKLESVTVLLGRDLPEEIRADKGIKENNFVEIRVERENPAFTEIVDLGSDTPAKKFTRLLRAI